MRRRDITRDYACDYTGQWLATMSLECGAGGQAWPSMLTKNDIIIRPPERSNGIRFSKLRLFYDNYVDMSFDGSREHMVEVNPN